jgi:hypothetical protein
MACPQVQAALTSLFSKFNNSKGFPSLCLNKKLAHWPTERVQETTHSLREASGISARRATQVDPMITLRLE